MERVKEEIKMDVRVNGAERLYEIKIFNKTTRGNVDADVVHRCRAWEHELNHRLFELRSKYSKGYYFIIDEI